ncbi:hypothetical protein BKA93DRAFT_785576 [Sparassis latifolia]|uniref:Protein unc-45 A n=1 Tax=Sparassis crispa TaxID=139825 RepID=A0A401G4Y9_9APHY|nr:Protein unc-45 A [Sparassis crispa]GBE77230.1 Protein unc-45 A [Sparassis crispa]
MSEPESDIQLDAILKKSQEKSWKSLLPDELNTVIGSFLPSHPLTLRSKAYIVLSAVCQRIRKDSSSPFSKEHIDASTDLIHRAFELAIVTRLADTEENKVFEGLSFLAALFEVDWQSASSIFQDEAILESLTDCMDIFASSLQMSRSVAHLLAQASGHKACRALISSQHLAWLSTQSRQASDSTLRAAAAVALVKLSRGMGSDAAEVGSAEKAAMLISDEELVKLMKGLVVDESNPSSVSDAVEGLAYSSTDPTVKELLSNDSSFLSRLFAFIPRRKGSSTVAEDMGMSPVFGAVVIISNLCAYRPRLTEEEAQMAKLRRMAKASPGSSSTHQEAENNPLDDDDHVRKRGRKLMQCGVMDALTAAIRATDSRAVRLAVGKAVLSLVEDKDNRGKVLQTGGAKALMTIIHSILPAAGPSSQSKKLPPMEASDIEPIQALAKLAITASPVQVFGPNEGALYDAIRPLSLMLLHPTSNLLQRFEALMALTNLSSQSAEVSSRIARTDGLLNGVELLMLEEHVLVRRAATELICNLVAGCEEVFNRYGAKSSKSKLQVLLALCDVDDTPTRLAASGALATVTSSPDACQALLDLQNERHRVLPILGQLVDPTIVSTDDNESEDADIEAKADPGLVHRGAVCVRNFFLAIEDSAAHKQLATEAERVGLVRALVGVVKTYSASGNNALLRPTAEALRWLIEGGMQIAA